MEPHARAARASTSYGAPMTPPSPARSPARTSSSGGAARRGFASGTFQLSGESAQLSGDSAQLSGGTKQLSRKLTARLSRSSSQLENVAAAAAAAATAGTNVHEPAVTSSRGKERARIGRAEELIGRGRTKDERG